MMADTRLRASRFNLSLHGFDGTPLLFNSATLSLVALDPHQAPAIKDLIKNPETGGDVTKRAGWVEQLRHGRFLVAADEDELELFRRLEWATRQDPEHLVIYVFPTLSCNVACPYCFIGRQPQRMDRSIGEGLLELVAARGRDAERLTVVWYGGEPLLELERVKRLSFALMDLAARLGLAYDAVVYTNGHLLTPVVARELRDCGVMLVHTAFDGPRAVHDRRRFLADGQGTYDTLIRNLRDAEGIIDRFLVRIHIDRETAPVMHQLLDDLHASGFHQRRDVIIRFARLEAETPTSRSAAGYCYEPHEYARVEAELARAALSRGLLTVAYPFHRHVYCMARKENEFAIGPDGRLFHCLAEVGHAAKATGSLATAPPAPDPEGNTRRFREDTFATKENCRKCRILPLCAGGCAYNGAARFAGRRGFCISLKYNIVDVLQIYHALHRPKARGGEIMYVFDPVNPTGGSDWGWILDGELVPGPPARESGA